MFLVASSGHSSYDRSKAGSKIFCMSAGGNLASVHSDEEYFFLREFIYKVTGANRESWIGGFDAVKEGVWQWSDGSNFDYKQWATGQPDNAGRVEHCLEMNYQDKLNDRPCQTVYPFVCSKKL
ncbi:galactose-specific lectin nattectin-like [Perca flavescens]|uniref:galactose-specific lectin nattectin-like n=1 Tax=Perca flavescens TaxID=8167 RepID=UPI00106E784E|nr:galactose-specific lectin nattectin-like [Perca flavescens]